MSGGARDPTWQGSYGCDESCGLGVADAGLEMVAYTTLNTTQNKLIIIWWVGLVCGCEGAAPPCSVEDDLISGEAGWLVAGCFWGGHEHTLITPGELAINKRKQYNQVLQGGPWYLSAGGAPCTHWNVQDRYIWVNGYGDSYEQPSMQSARNTTS